MSNGNILGTIPSLIGTAGTIIIAGTTVRLLDESLKKIGKKSIKIQPIKMKGLGI